MIASSPPVYDLDVALLLRDSNATTSLYNCSNEMLHGNCQKIKAVPVLFTAKLEHRFRSIKLNQVAVI
jgi:hypothetical protein